MSEQPVPSERAARLAPHQLFILFTQISALGFGGVLPWAYRVLVERRRLLGNTEFGELFALGQILPGPNICNVAVLFGYRHAGVRGGFAALAGIVGVPTLIVILFGIAYQRFGTVEMVRDAVAGMAPVAAGLIAATAIKMALNLPRRWKQVLFAGLMFVAMAIVRWPLVSVMAILVPLALVAFAKDGHRERR